MEQKKVTTTKSMGFLMQEGTQPSKADCPKRPVSAMSPQSGPVRWHGGCLRKRFLSCTYAPHMNEVTDRYGNTRAGSQ